MRAVIKQDVKQKQLGLANNGWKKALGESILPKFNWYQETHCEMKNEKLFFSSFVEIHGVVLFLNLQIQILDLFQAARYSEISDNFYETCAQVRIAEVRIAQVRTAQVRKARVRTA